MVYESYQVDAATAARQYRGASINALDVVVLHELGILSLLHAVIQLQKRILYVCRARMARVAKLRQEIDKAAASEHSLRRSKCRVHVLHQLCGQWSAQCKVAVHVNTVFLRQKLQSCVLRQT